LAARFTAELRIPSLADRQNASTPTAVSPLTIADAPVASAGKSDRVAGISPTRRVPPARHATKLPASGNLRVHSRERLPAFFPAVRASLDGEWLAGHRQTPLPARVFSVVCFSAESKESKFRTARNQLIF